MKSKKTIFYCDDQKQFIEKFKENHGDEYNIETTNDINKYQQFIADHMDRHIKPDLILIDLYHPNDVGDSEQNINEAEQKLAELSKTIDDIRPYIERAWLPSGIDVLKSLRNDKRLDGIPILFYTQRGLLFMNDDQMKTIYENDCDWVLKDKRRESKIAERERINQIIRTYEKRHNKIKNLSLALWSGAGGVLIGFIGSELANLVHWFPSMF